jgi:ATP-dependent DNA helicase RecG
VLVIRIGPGERVHRTTAGDCYLRIGDESRRLSFTQERELLFDRGQAQYDGEAAPGVAPADLDQKLVASYARAIGHPDASRVLGARSLLTRDGELTNAAYLLFGKHPQDAFPQALVRVVRYAGRERGTGARLTITDDVRAEGPIPTVIHAAQKEIERLMPVRRHLGVRGRFVDSALVPRDAWLEGLVNAVVHRSYSLAGDHIRIEIFDNRIEIESPGRFPGLVDVENPLKIARFARNPRIARVCADLRITQELGEGIRRIFEEMRHAGLNDPLYRQTSGSVRLTLEASPRLNPKVAATLPPGSTDVLRLLDSADRQLGTGDIAESLGVSRPTVLQRLNALRDAGLVEWHGKSAQDPRAYWILAPES